MFAKDEFPEWDWHALAYPEIHYQIDTSGFSLAANNFKCCTAKRFEFFIGRHSFKARLIVWVSLR